MQKLNTKINKKQNSNRNRQGLLKASGQFNHLLLWNRVKKQQIANLKQIEKMKKKYDKKFKEVFSLLKQFAVKNK